MLLRSEMVALATACARAFAGTALTAALFGCMNAPLPGATLPLTSAASTTQPAPKVGDITLNLETWPVGAPPLSRDPAIEARIASLLATMTLEEKVGQVIQADTNSVTPEDVKTYHLGSILSGGNSGPNGDDRAPARTWLEYADKFYDVSVDVEPGRPRIPLIWGSDAVHGNANIIGATIFPHNIGLGAAHDPDLIRRIGKITALELRVIGGDWTFAPTIAVVRDDRWGRTYEGYSEDPEIVKTYASAIVRGIQGDVGAPDFLRGPHVIATAKHFIGDGGTRDGKDQGDTELGEAEFRDLFSPGYYAAIAAGVQSVMASYNAWRGEKMHGARAMLTDVLRSRMHFDGFSVGDWNGHGQVQGCTATDCAASLNAGLDMYMAPDSWKALYVATLASAKSGEIPMPRLDEAVGNILRVKIRAGILEARRPSEREYAGRFDLLGSAEHRAVAREAVRKSLVLLKNEARVLPLDPRKRILVAGDGADSMSKQTGGWTISWQGADNVRADFPNAQTIYEAIREEVQKAGGKVELSVDGAYKTKPDAAIVVFGEDPYAEFQGDRPHLDYQSENDRDLALLRKLKGAGIPVVAVFLSGRPMYVNPEINASDAFVAAWLPGSEGGGVADLLLTSLPGNSTYDFTGRLTFSWPKAPDQTPLNRGDATYDPQFAYGFGLSLASSTPVGQLVEVDTTRFNEASADRFFAGGRATGDWALSSEGAVTLGRTDRLTQEDSLLVRWTGAGSAKIFGPAADLSRQANGDMALVMDVRVDALPASGVSVSMECASGGACAARASIDGMLAAAPGEWRQLAIRLSCFAAKGVDMSKVTTPMKIDSASSGAIALSNIRLAQLSGAPPCPSTAGR